jgi:hypothetical protein
MLALSDPTVQTQTDLETQLDLIFMILYTMEMCLKIFGLGFFINKVSINIDLFGRAPTLEIIGI